MSGAGEDRREELPEICPGLFLVNADDAAPCRVYFLTRDDLASPGETPGSIAEIWSASEPDQPGVAKYYGWFLFLAEPISRQDAEWFVQHARKTLPPLVQRNWHGIVWLRSIHDPPAVSIIVQWSAAHFVATGGPSFDFGAFALAVSNQAVVPITLDTSGPPAFLITAMISDAGLIRIYYEGLPQAPYLPSGGWLIAIPLDGPQNGSLRFNVALDIGLLANQFGCCMRYGYGNPAAAMVLQFPVFPPAAAQPQRRPVAFNLRLNPVWPLRADCTAFELDFSGGIQPSYSANARAIATSC